MENEGVARGTSSTTRSAGRPGPDVFRPCAPRENVADSGRVAWYLHAIELPGGLWTCRWSRRDLDSHPSLDEALAHLRSLSAELGECELFAHRADGAVVRLGPA